MEGVHVALETHLFCTPAILGNPTNSCPAWWTIILLADVTLKTIDL